MIKLFITLLPILTISNAHASGGFTWLGSIAHRFHIPGHLITSIFIGLFLFVVGLLYRRTVSKTENSLIPDKGTTFRNIVEAYGQFIYNQCKAVIGEDKASTYFPFISFIFLFILVSNVIGLIPGFLPPTEYLSLTLALGVVSFIYYNIKGCKEMGVLNYIKHFAGPMWYLAVLIFPIEIISNLIRPLSLALRLQGNMSGDHMVLSIFSELSPLFVPVIFMMLGLLVSFIQAYVFTVLSMVYISLATTHQDHGEEAHH